MIEQEKTKQKTPNHAQLVKKQKICQIMQNKKNVKSCKNDKAHYITHAPRML
jgi:hypothetical protein